MNSEFGKGLCYNLGLFLAHADRYRLEKEKYELLFRDTKEKDLRINRPEMWFNASADHLYDLQVNSAPKNLQKRLKTFQGKCLSWRMVFSEEDSVPTEKDIDWAIQEAKELLRLIDKANGIKVIKGDWE